MPLLTCGLCPALLLSVYYLGCLLFLLACPFVHPPTYLSALTPWLHNTRSREQNKWREKKKIIHGQMWLSIAKMKKSGNGCGAGLVSMISQHGSYKPLESFFLSISLQDVRSFYFIFYSNYLNNFHHWSLVKSFCGGLSCACWIIQNNFGAACTKLRPGGLLFCDELTHKRKIKIKFYVLYLLLFRRARSPRPKEKFNTSD